MPVCKPAILNAVSMALKTVPIFPLVIKYWLSIPFWIDSSGFISGAKIDKAYKSDPVSQPAMRR